MSGGEDRDRKLERAIGQRIRNLRIERGLSQSDLAEKLLVTYQQVQKYERGDTHLSIVRLLHVAEALSVDAASLVGRAWSEVGEPRNPIRDPEPTAGLTDEERRFLRLFRRLRDPRMRRDLFHYLRLKVEAQRRPEE